MKGGYLIDTSVISVLAPERTELTAEFADWIRTNQSNLYVSVITIMEIDQGIRKLVRKGASRKAASLTTWLADLEEAMDQNILDVTRSTAKSAASLIEQTTAAGWHPGYPDILIAATALANGMSVLTRNMRHFQAMSVACRDPLTSLPH